MFKLPCARWQAVAPSAGFALALAACSPALDWREVRAAGGSVTLLFPCKPTTQERQLTMAGQPWSAVLQVCEAGAVTFSALTLSLPEGATGGADRASALSDLIQTAAQRWGVPQGEQTAPEGVRLPGAMASAAWARYERRADAGTVDTQALFFVSDRRLVQLSMHGSRLDPAAVEAFFGQLRTAPR